MFIFLSFKRNIVKMVSLK